MSHFDLESCDILCSLSLRIPQINSRDPKVCSWETDGSHCPCSRAVHHSWSCPTHSAPSLPLQALLTHTAVPVRSKELIFWQAPQHTPAFYIFFLLKLDFSHINGRISCRHSVCKHILVCRPNQVTHTHSRLWSETLLFLLFGTRLFITPQWQWCQYYWHPRDPPTHASEEASAWDWQPWFVFRGTSARRK